MQIEKRRILVVDDDDSIRTYLARFLSSRGYEVDCLDSGAQVMSRLMGTSRPSVVLLDLLMPSVNGLEILAQMEKVGHPAPAIVLSAVGHVATVVKAVQMGAADYLLKPFEDQELELAIQNALGNPAPAKTIARQSPVEGHQRDLLSVSRKVLRIKEIAALVADTDVPVLISGESGAGKEVVARYIHARSNRRDELLLKINCAALPADLLESELFGHEKGAFTGAFREKPGKFELAKGGTILLDEIAEMTPNLQAKLLHVLQDGEFTRLGGTSPLRTDVRILAATNKPLEAAVESGEFRQDLYFRLNVIHIEIPPLRERLEDVPILARHFVEKYAEKYGNGPLEVPREMMDDLCRYHWPGNTRQLENVIKRFLILRDPALALADLRQPAPGANAPSVPENVSFKERSAMAVQETEKEIILQTLDETNWNRKEAARRLDICYKSLLKKLHKWGISSRTSSAGKTCGSAVA
jgi:two-component system response regulator AtoC